MLKEYRLNCVEVVLVYDHDAANCGLGGLQVAEAGGQYAIPLASLLARGCDMDVLESISQCTYDDSYGGGYEYDDILAARVVNVENGRRLIECFCTAGYAAADEAERMLTVCTGRYYGWTSDYTRFKGGLDSCILNYLQGSPDSGEAAEITYLKGLYDSELTKWRKVWGGYDTTALLKTCIEVYNEMWAGLLNEYGLPDIQFADD